MNKKLNPGRYYWSCGTWQINSCESNIGCSGIPLSNFFLCICFVCRGEDCCVYLVYMSFLAHGILELFFVIDPLDVGDLFQVERKYLLIDVLKMLYFI